MRTAALLTFISLAVMGRAEAQAPTLPEHVTSPNARVQADVALDSSGALTYQVSLGQQLVIAPSLVGLNLGLDTLDMPRVSTLANNLQVLSVDHRQGEDDYVPLFGKTSSVHDAYTEIRVHAQETSGRHRKIDLVVRAYNDGVAFRLILPDQPNLSVVRIAAEETRFAFPSDYACTGLNPGQYESPHEGEFDDINSRYIRRHDLYDVPLVCRTGQGGTTFALTESDIENYAGAYFSGRSDGGRGVQINLTPRKDNPAIAVSTPMTPDGVKTPWRVILLADRPEKLLESNLVTNLAQPSRVEDTSWIKPGLATWDWWSGTLFLPGQNVSSKEDSTYKKFIDLAARLGLPYMLIDSGWNHDGGGGAVVRPGNDITQSLPSVHLPELVAYAREKHVGLLLWVNWEALDRQMEEAMSLYERLGIRGIKVDFVNREDQYVVDYYHRVLSQAARHHLMVDFHGAFVPRGLERTYPNYITQEGVMGAEYNKWSTRVTASHNVRLAYTRALLGPMDYTPGGFRNTRPSDFVISNIGPDVQTTRAQQLAMYVVYTSWVACLSDSPSAYEGPDGTLQPGMDFFEHVPTTWDETRAVSGEFGQYIAVARRKGTEWYLGLLNDETARTVAVPLDFLAPRQWKTQEWADGAAPTDLKIDAGTARGGSGTLSLSLASGGGAVVLFKPE